VTLLHAPPLTRRGRVELLTHPGFLTADNVEVIRFLEL
jgi:hypothetical protein